MEIEGLTNYADADVSTVDTGTPESAEVETDQPVGDGSEDSGDEGAAVAEPAGADADDEDDIEYDQDGQPVYTVEIDGAPVKLNATELRRGYLNARQLEAARRADLEKLQRFDSLFTTLKSAPNKADALRRLLESPELGLKAGDVAMEILTDQLRKDAMTPEQKRLAELEEQVAQYRQTEERRQQEARTAQIEEYKAKYATEIEQGILGALDKHKLDATPEVMGRAIYYLRAAHQRNIPLRPQDAVAKVAEDYRKEIRNLTGKYTPEQLIEAFGEDVVAKLRQHDVQQYRSRGAAPAPKPAAPPRAKRQQEAPRTFAEVADRLLNGD